MVCSLARAVELGHAVLHRGPRASASCCVMSAKERVSPLSSSRPLSTAWCEVARRHLPHAIGQQQQRPRELVAQHHGQQHRTEKTARNKASVSVPMYAPQAVAAEGALPGTLAVGLLQLPAHWLPAPLAAPA